MSLRNYRGISECEINFHPKMNIIIGNNGVGKTSILDACALLLGQVIPYSSKRPIRFRRSDLRKNSRDGEIKLSFNSGLYASDEESKEYNVKLEFSEEEFNFKVPFSDKRDNVIAKIKLQSQLLDQTKKIIKKLEDIAKMNDIIESKSFNKEPIFLRILLSSYDNREFEEEKLNFELEKINENINKYKKDLPLVVYYRTERTVINIQKQTNKEHRFYQEDGYDNCLTGKTDFSLFFEWYRNQDDIINQELRETETLNDILKYVKESITEFTGFHNIKLERRGRQKLLLSKTMPNGIESELNMDLLSQGEKIYIALIGDIAKRLTMLNPYLKNPLEGEGVILIDEVELHLHPKWQREIFKKLVKIFPNCQFIVTTHSPQIISSSKEASIFILNEEGSTEDRLEKDSNMYGKTSNQVLEYIMNTEKRDGYVENKLDEIHKLIDNKDLEEAEKKINALEEIIGDDLEINKLEAIISRIKILGK